MANAVNDWLNLKLEGRLLSLPFGNFEKSIIKIEQPTKKRSFIQY